jgi:serine/threonine protein kinase
MIEIVETIHKGNHIHVYRMSNGTVLKSLISNFTNQREIDKLRKEYEIGQLFQGCNHVIQFIDYSDIYSQLSSNNLQSFCTACITMEDFGGRCLSSVIPTHGFPIHQFLDIAIQLVLGLNEIHRKNVIHRDIKSDNILVNIQTGLVKYIDFGIASTLREVNPRMNFSKLEATLAYIAPEATGRMNRVVDYRTDFYMLGVTLYEMLCGHLPFNSADARELVYCHLAKEPVTPYEARTKDRIPTILSDIVMKLLKKNPEDRYQSSAGLLSDLTNCREQLKKNRIIEPFPIATKDISEKFTIPNKLYGREKEIEKLVDTFERVRKSSSEILIVSGYSGIGKSTVSYFLVIISNKISSNTLFKS